MTTPTDEELNAFSAGCKFLFAALSDNKKELIDATKGTPGGEVFLEQIQKFLVGKEMPQPLAAITTLPYSLSHKTLMLWQETEIKKILSELRHKENVVEGSIRDHEHQ